MLFHIGLRDTVVSFLVKLEDMQTWYPIGLEIGKWEQCVFICCDSPLFLFLN